MTDRTKTNRRRLRTVAMQVLAHCDVQGPESAAKDMPLFVADAALNEVDAEFVAERINAVVRRWTEIDREIASAASNWKIKRIAVPDRAVLRLAVGELLGCPDVPPKVVINEAIELARTFGTSESPQFVNGVLDAIHHRLIGSDS